ncbi:MAG: type I polyketide synthase, partial [Myxococcales bacterium]
MSPAYDGSIFEATASEPGCGSLGDAYTFGFKHRTSSIEHQGAMREVLLSHASKSDFVSPEQTVAVIGIGCILPGNVNSPSELEALLLSRRSCVVGVPPDRWAVDQYSSSNRAAPGKLYVTRAGFLSRDVLEFDAEPFAISPREADRLDPQQRLLLETTWNTLEDAGVPVSTVRGTRTAVFVGGFSLDAQSIAQSEANHHLVDSHTAAGGSMTMLSNRLSHVFDLRGPSVTLDTACSSSLVAIHLARQAILHEDCPMAIAGGVNVMLSPSPMLAMCKGQFLAPDGRSKAFDAAANGYGRGEGAAVVLLKRLDLALADHNRIYAIIHASGVNQDGHTDGISLPSGEAQQSLARAVLGASGLRSTDIGYIEAHGTGTRVGDPIEARALGAVYGAERAHPVVVGSLKTNLGHLEAAAGVTGFIKATLSVCHRTILPQLGPETLNPDIPLEQLNLRIANDVEAFGQGAAIAAINSFGYGGTNAHVIVGEWQSSGPVRNTDRPKSRAHGWRIAPISAMNTAALSQLAGTLAKTITDTEWEDQLYSLARMRDHLPERAAIVAGSAEQLRVELGKVVEGVESEVCIRSRAEESSRLAWVFTGMGPQWWAMGRELLKVEPVFAQTLRELDGLFLRLSGWSPLDELLRDEQHSRVSANDVAQITNFLIQAGLTELLRAYGIPMHAALGHSAGEVAATLAAGCLTKRE